MKTFKYRIYPTPMQEGKLTWTLDRCREVYNAALQERRDSWNNVKRHPHFHLDGYSSPTFDGYCLFAKREHSISLYDQQNQLSLMKKERTDFAELSAAHILNDVCARVDKAMKAFFDRTKKGKTPGFPRFQGKNRYDSFTYPDKSGWAIDGKKLDLRKIGVVKVWLHRPIDGTIKTCTIKREGDQWYVTFACEVEAKRLPVSYEDVGIDLGITHFAALSTGEVVDNPRYYRRGARVLERRQQSLSRKKRGSKRREKARKLVARAHRKVRNQRTDFLHKQSYKVVQRFQTIVFEDLQTVNLVRRPRPKQDVETGEYLPNGAAAKGGLNKSISDAGWATFMEMCTYKAASAGRTLQKVNPHYTSQTCSGCGVVRTKELSERWHSCECGANIDRDVNAAINILRVGQQQIHARDAGVPSGTHKLSHGLDRASRGNPANTSHLLTLPYQ